jgi:hypothetical protein
MTPDNQSVKTVQESPNTKELPPEMARKQGTSKRLLLRYGVVAVLVVALVALTGLLLQSRSEAQAGAQPTTEQATGQSTNQWVYAQVPGVQNTQPTAAAPEATPVVPPAASSVSLVPTVTPTPQVIAEAAPQLADSIPTASAPPVSVPAAPAASVLTASPSESSNALGVIRASGANVVDSPDGNVVETLFLGDEVTALARSADSQWLSVMTPSGKSGWVAASDVIIYDVENLPVQETGVANPVAEATGADTTGADTTDTDTTATVAPDTGTAPAQPAAAAGLRPAPVLKDGDVAATVVLNGSNLNIRSGPGTAYEIVASAKPQEQFLVVARNYEGTWVQIQLPEARDEVAWVSADYVTLTADVQMLPVSEQAASQPQANSASPAVSAFVDTQSALQGNLVVQSGNGGAINVYNLATGAMRTLTTGFDPAVSPDGQTVAFARGGGEQGLYLIDIDGSNEHRIYNGGEDIAAPSWSPDGQELVFRRSTGSYDCREVGFGICLPDNSPFLKGFPLGEDPQYGLSRIDRNGENFRDINSLTMSQAPDWNQAGIVYASHPSIEITSDAPGVTTHRVVAQDFYQDPDWQPNGGRIVFQSKRGDHWEIFAVNPDGSGLVALTKPVTNLVDELPDNVAPSWSPDGQHIVYLSSRDDNNDQGKWRVWVMNADGSNQHPLPVDMEIQYNYGNEQAVSWGV